MNNLMLSIPSKTIKEIRDVSGIPVYIRRRLPDNIDILIRWGSTRPAMSNTTYNSIQAIKLTADKPRCRQVLAAAGVPVPQNGTDIFPCIGRTRKHSGGKGLWFCQTPLEIEIAKMEGADYFSQFYPKTKEFRVHIGCGKVILYSEKLGDKFGTVIWNHDITGFKFKHIGRGERRKDIIDLAKKAIEVVGLDFGAVDILADPLYPQLPQAVVCEINSAPGLSPMATKKYSEYFNGLLTSQEEYGEDNEDEEDQSWWRLF